ncbi:carbohydrate sulfotransferase 1-like [Saccoglossus kowalevskii]|uniref:Carbohydrate sulfotransferase 1-like n=1 Tax=Saccoglossus kowalevskii TaxID=10224 RepID=A0ABM0MEU2_SACKO|nr:PREDICTED: carbohydrate sulfotransferase 1-like [Saccoglossus kowalevskii]
MRPLAICIAPVICTLSVMLYHSYPVTAIKEVLPTNSSININTLNFKKNRKGKSIILVASHRTGSSFTGELLNANHDILYLFEPLRYIEGNANKFNQMSNIFHCQFTKSYINTIRDRQGVLRFSQGLRNIFKPRNKFKTPSPIDLSRMCNTYPHIAMKVIRLESLQQLEPLVLGDKLDLKILHLIRDPRGVASSEMNILKTISNNSVMWKLKSLDPITKNYCQRAVNMLDFSYNLPASLQGRYKLIRYEDIAIDTFNSTIGIYNFLELPLHQSVSNWIVENTKASNSSGFMITNKNSTAASESWRTRLQFEDVEIIQNLSPCDELMNIMGYHKLESLSQMNNMSLRSF